MVKDTNHFYGYFHLRLLGLASVHISKGPPAQVLKHFVILQKFIETLSKI
jgi:hypothetical protein